MDAYRTLISLPTHEQAWVIVLVLSVLCTAAILLERMVYLFVSHQNQELLQALVFRHLDTGDVENAAKAAYLSRSCFGRVLLAGLTTHVEENIEAIRPNMEGRLASELNLLERRTITVAFLAGFNGILSLMSLYWGTKTDVTWILTGLALLGAVSYFRIALWISSTEKSILRHIALVEKRLLELVA